MQGDTPQGDPRLQKINPGSVVAIGLVDPCIVFLEIPLLAACFARSSCEVRDVVGNSCLALERVLAIQNQSLDHIDHRRLWEFGMQKEQAVFLICGGKDGAFAKCDYKASTFKSAPGPVFKWHVRFLNGKEAAAIQRTIKKFEKDFNEVAGIILRRADVDWPSIADAISAIRRHEKKQRRRKHSLVRRVISTIFKKKNPKLVAA